MSTHDVVMDIFWTCAFTWFYVYGAYVCSCEFVSKHSVFPMLGVLIIFLLIRLVKLPSPDEDTVLEVFGYDLYLESEMRDGYAMKSIAHRGAAMDAPENSMAAIRLAKSKGCTAVEIDVSITSDGVPIIFHDPTADRVTTEWDELRGLARHPEENVPLLGTAVLECISLDLRVILDLKGFSSRLIWCVLNMFDEYEDLYKRVAVSSFNPVMIYLIRRANPKIVCALAWRPAYYSALFYSGLQGEGPARHSSLPMNIVARLADIINTWFLENLAGYVLGLSAVLLHKDTVSPHVVGQWHQRGMRVISWTVNSAHEKRYLAQVVRVAYITDTLHE